MRSFFLTATIALTAIACSGIQEGAAHAPDTPGDAMDVVGEPGTDPGGPDADADEGPRPDAPAADDGVVANDADTPITTDEGVVKDEGVGPETDVGPGTLDHLGWFGPGGIVTGSGMSSLGSLSGPQQAWRVK